MLEIPGFSFMFIFFEFLDEKLVIVFSKDLLIFSEGIGFLAGVYFFIHLNDSGLFLFNNFDKISQHTQITPSNIIDAYFLMPLSSLYSLSDLFYVQT